MSGVNFLEKLLDGVDIEWMALGDFSEIYDGTHQTPKYVDSGVPFVSVQNIKDLSGTDKYISVEDFEKYKCKPRASDLFMTRIGDVGTCAIVSNDEPLAYYVTLALIRSNQNIVNPKYILHVLHSGIGKSELYKRTLIHAVPMKINLGEIGKLLIPIPCPENPKKSLEIQAEIVRILDAFAELTTELTTELTARKKQYNYYRDQLLSFEEGDVEWKTLGDVVATIKTGKLNANAMAEDGKYPFFTCDATPFKIDTYAFDTEAIIVSGNGSQVGHINYYKGKFNAYQRTYILADCADGIRMGFLLTYLKAYLRPYIMQHSKKGSVPYITMPMLQSFKVPIPSVEKQVEITLILDKFDALTNSLTEGLPHEIELRQKQYEYYRDLLLSFPKPEAPTVAQA